MEKAFAIALCAGMLASTPMARAMEVPACEKNHFILEGPGNCGVPALHASIGAPSAVAVDADGNVYFSSPNVVYMLDTAGFVRRIAGDGTPGFSGDGGPATQARLNFPEIYPELEKDPLDYMEMVGSLAVDATGNLYIADAYNNRIRKVDRDGIITTVVGLGPSGLVYAGMGYSGRVSDLYLLWPQGIGVGPRGNLVVADALGYLYDIAADGPVTEWAHSRCGTDWPGLCAPEGLAIDVRGTVYVADNWCGVSKAIGPGLVTSVAGCGRGNFREGGPATAGRFGWPYAVAVDAAGQLFIADTYADAIRKVDTQGLITTVAGLSVSLATVRDGMLGDGGPAIGAQLRQPHGVAIDAAGNLYIADTGNRRIRRVGVDGVITTIAGNGRAVATKEAVAR